VNRDFLQNEERSYLWDRSFVENDKKLNYFRCSRLLLDLQDDPAFLVFIIEIFGSLLTSVLGSDFASATSNTGFS
jgi:hypothetical protein